jgi:hypothetical protein
MRRFAKIYIPRAEIEPKLHIAHVVRSSGRVSGLQSVFTQRSGSLQYLSPCSRRLELADETLCMFRALQLARPLFRY